MAEAVWNALTAKSPRLRYPVGKGVALSRMRRFVPAGMFDKSFRKQFQLDGPVNAPVTKHPNRQSAYSNGRRQRTSEPPHAVGSHQLGLAVVADEVGFVKIDRRPLMTIGLLAGGLTVALMAGGLFQAGRERSAPAVSEGGGFQGGSGWLE